MMRLAALTAILTLGMTSSPASSARPFKCLEKTTDIVRVNVVDVARGAVLPGRTVTIGCGRIIDIRPGTASGRRDARRIDGRGRFLAPGLVDAHGHRTGQEGFRRAYLLYGVTAVRDMDGRPEAFAAAGRVRSGELAGPWPYLASPIINGGEPEWKQGEPAAAARAIVEKARARGAEYIKVYFQLTPAQFGALSTAGARAAMPLVGHVPRSMTLQNALPSMRSIEHLTGFDDALEDPSRHVSGPGSAMLTLRRFAAADRSRIAPLARAVSRSGVWQVPTLYGYEIWTDPGQMKALSSDPVLRRLLGDDAVDRWTKPKPFYVTPIDQQTSDDRQAIAEAVKVRRAVVRALHQAGAKLAIGTDAGELFTTPGLAFHQEIRILSEIGFSPSVILRMATVNGAALTGHRKEFGVVAPGQRADLLLLSANPLRDLRALERPLAVISGGRIYERAELNNWAGVASARELPSAYGAP